MLTVSEAAGVPEARREGSVPGLGDKGALSEVIRCEILGDGFEEMMNVKTDAVVIESEEVD